MTEVPYAATPEWRAFQERIWRIVADRDCYRHLYQLQLEQTQFLVKRNIELVRLLAQAHGDPEVPA